MFFAQIVKHSANCKWNFSYTVSIQINIKCLFTELVWSGFHSTKKPVTTTLTYPWKCTLLHCNHLGNTWKPLVLMTWHFDYCPSTSEGDNQSVRSSAPVVSRCFPGGYNVKLYISRGRLAWWLLAFLHSVLPFPKIKLWIFRVVTLGNKHPTNNFTRVFFHGYWRFFFTWVFPRGLAFYVLAMFVHPYFDNSTESARAVTRLTSNYIVGTWITNVLMESCKW